MNEIRRALSAILGSIALFAATGLAHASNVAPDPETQASPHQELMTFLLRQPTDPERFAGKRVAMILGDGADAVTFQLARDYLQEQGAAVDVLTPRKPREMRDVEVAVSTWDYAGNERPALATAFLDETDPRGYALIYLPGNHPDAQSLEANAEVAQYAARASAAGKPLFAMGDASLMLARSNLLYGRQATGARSVQSFLVWSGVDVRDEPVVRDSLIYTSRDAFDLPRMMSVMEQVLGAP
jgi:protease I